MNVINTVYSDGEKVRVDIFTAKAADVTRSRAAGLIGDGNVLINGKIANKKDILKLGDQVSITLPDPIEPDIAAENIPLNIVYEDDDLLVVNKPKGMVVHPAAGNYSGTLVNALMHHCGNTLSGINGVMRPGIVHRIDKNTSGLLMVAKNDFSHNVLAAQIKDHTFNREYAAIVYGNLKAEMGEIRAPIGRHPTKRKQMAVVPDGREAVTHYSVKERLNGFTYVNLKLETGRTHQIRVHMSYIGHPVAGDDVYGPKKVITCLGGQCLHAQKLGFVHPRSQKYMEFNSVLPEYFEKFLKGCKF